MSGPGRVAAKGPECLWTCRSPGPPVTDLTPALSVCILLAPQVVRIWVVRAAALPAGRVGVPDHRGS